MMFCLSGCLLSQSHSELVLIVEQRAILSGTGASPVFAIYSTMGIDHLWILHNSFVAVLLPEKTFMGMHAVVE